MILFFSIQNAYSESYASNYFVSIGLMSVKQTRRFDRGDYQFDSKKRNNAFSVIFAKKFNKLSLGIDYTKYKPSSVSASYIIKGVNIYSCAKYKSTYVGGYLSYEMPKIYQISPFISFSLGKSINQWSEEIIFSGLNMNIENRKYRSSAYKISLGGKLSLSKNLKSFFALSRSNLGYAKRSKLMEGIQIDEKKHKLISNNIELGIEYHF